MPPTQDVQSVTFERPLEAQMMAIDGTWRRPRAVKTISESGATLTVEVSIEGLGLFRILPGAVLDRSRLSTVRARRRQRRRDHGQVSSRQEQEARAHEEP